MTTNESNDSLPPVIVSTPRTGSAAGGDTPPEEMTRLATEMPPMPTVINFGMYEHIIGLCPRCKKPLSLSRIGGKLGFVAWRVDHILTGKSKCEPPNNL